jgi:hypothetical protein
MNPCSHCRGPVDRNGRYCKACHAEYQRLWRSKKDTATRMLIERHQAEFDEILAGLHRVSLRMLHVEHPPSDQRLQVDTSEDPALT